MVTCRTAESEPNGQNSPAPSMESPGTAQTPHQPVSGAPDHSGAYLGPIDPAATRSFQLLGNQNSVLLLRHHPQQRNMWPNRPTQELCLVCFARRGFDRAIRFLRRLRAVSHRALQRVRSGQSKRIGLWVPFGPKGQKSPEGPVCLQPAFGLRFCTRAFPSPV